MAIVVAFITAMGGVIGALVQRGRRENSRDHSNVISRLDKVQETMMDVQSSIVSHLTWHDKEKE